VDLSIRYDFDLTRRKANEKEYLLPKNFIIKLEPHGMTIHLENLFNGNKILGKLVYRQPVRVCAPLLQMTFVEQHSEQAAKV